MPKATFTRALPAYLGGKRRLAPLLFAELATVLPQAAWDRQRFVDPMCGGGAVAQLAKAYGFEVYASDRARRGSVVAAALIANSRVRLAEPDWLAALRAPPPTPAAAGPALFSPAHLRVIAGLQAAAAGRAGAPRALLELLLIKLVLRSFPVSLPSASAAAAAAAGEYDALSSRRVGHYLRAQRWPTPAGVRTLAAEINGGVIGGRGHAAQGDALAVLAQTPADVVYLDPPYPGTTGYARSYAVLDRLLGDEAAPDQPPTLDALLDAAHEATWVVLSYGGPDCALEAIAGRVGRHRPVRRACAVPYPRLPALATAPTNAASAEFIVIAGR